MTSELAQNNDNQAVLMQGHMEVFCVFEGTSLSAVFDKTHFEAISDGDLPLRGSRGKVPIVYVMANQHKLIQAAVMFYLPLDDKGYVLDGWRLPLQRLADTAGRGPNLGGGRIRLACHSQCSISWHKEALWDPTTSTFVAIKKAIQHESNSAFLEKQLDDMGSMPTDAEEIEDIDSLRRKLRNETAAYRNQLQSLQQEIERQRLLNERLHRKIDTDEQSLGHQNKLDLTALRQQNEQLTMRVRELEVLNDRLHTELHQKGSEAQEDETQNTDVDSLIEQMAKSEMLSVVFHPGAGHINLAPAQLLEYLEDPIAYAAHQVNLSKEQYQIWMDHHDTGKCQVCDDRISVIGNPRIFDPEVDVYCDKHKPI